jgi:hypothetical protein
LANAILVSDILPGPGVINRDTVETIVGMRIPIERFELADFHHAVNRTNWSDILQDFLIQMLRSPHDDIGEVGAGNVRSTA